MPVSPSLGFVSTYAPTQCGLASFTASLMRAVSVEGADCSVVRLVDPADAVTRAIDVSHHLIRGNAVSVAHAAKVLNGHDGVVIQHEFGIYGGRDGDEVLALISQLTVPVIVVMHTVLTAPSEHQRMIMDELLIRAAAVVTMTDSARTRLVVHYDVDPAAVTVIPHGAPPPTMSTGSAAEQTMLTWGLLGPGKGIEAAIDILPRLAQRGLRPIYQVAGQTHPKVAERDGEAYRTSLVDRARDLGVADQLVFLDSYLDAPTLEALVARASVVVLPYESREQVTSGVLIEAVAAGRPVVATAFPHAVELLGGGSGIVVPHGDLAAMTSAVARVLTEPDLAAAMSSRSRRLLPELLWSSVASRYLDLATTVTTPRMVVAA